MREDNLCMRTYLPKPDARDGGGTGYTGSSDEMELYLLKAVRD